MKSNFELILAVFSLAVLVVDTGLGQLAEPTGQRVIPSQTQRISPYSAPPLSATNCSGCRESGLQESTATRSVIASAESDWEPESKFTSVIGRQTQRHCMDAGEYHQDAGFPVNACCCRDSRCRLCLQIRGVAEAIRNRELSPGDMVSRQAYVSQDGYYYDRPYVPILSGQREPNQVSPFSNSLATQVNEETASRLSSGYDGTAESELVTDGYLEFVDWQKHRESRLRTHTPEPVVSPGSVRRVMTQSSRVR